MKKLLYLLILTPVLLYGQNFNDALRLTEPGLKSGARALGMGNSYVALSDDVSGMVFNPAGLGLVKRSEFSGSINYNSFKNNTSFMGNETEYSNSSTNFSSFGFVYSVPTTRGSLVFGFGYNQLKDFNRAMKFDGFNQSSSYIDYLAWQNSDIPWELYLSGGSIDNQTTEITGQVNQDGSTLQEGDLNAWSFSAAIEAARNVYIGLTFNVLSGEFKSNREIYEEDTRNAYQGVLVTGVQDTEDFIRFYLNDIIDWDVTGWDAKLGFLYDNKRNMRIGATVKFPSKYTVTELYSLDSYSDFAVGNYEFSSEGEEFEYDISTPFEFAGGVAYSLPNLVLSGQVEFMDYSEMEFTQGLGDLQNREDMNKEIKNLMTSTLSYNAGLEYYLPAMDIRVRGGFMYRPSAFKGDPSEYDKKYVTGGIGFVPSEKVALDLAYAHGWWQTIGDNYGVEESRTFQDINSNTFILSILFRY